MFNFEKEDSEQMAREIDMVTGQIVVMGEHLFNKMADSPEFFAAIARCYKTAIAEFEKAGFSKAEAYSLAIQSIGNLGKSK